mmetsp:Transcript_15341/g.47536  ORF Transcript_15341/g.47536 Transcript_15341/m.47536 type:complete len:416 (-) Transcript_15341:246-1493(-)
MPLRRVVLLFAAANSKIVFPRSAPRGYNTFDTYDSQSLNTSAATALAEAMAAQLLPSGYEYFALDAGWDRTDDTQHLDAWGRPVAAPRYDLPKLASTVRGLGLKLGLWTIRGVHVDAVAKKLPVYGMEQYTLDQLVDQGSPGGGPNGSCLWKDTWLGVNMSHPAAQRYYQSRVDLLVEAYGVEFIKADCMMCAPCYADEIYAFSTAVEARPDENIVLSYSPGGGNTAEDGAWVASERLGSMYRIVTDFHGGWYGGGSLQQSLFIQGNFSNAGLAGANGTWPDPDMLPIKSTYWNQSQEQDDRGATIMTAWTLSGAPLIYGGDLPADARTIAYLTNPTALDIHARAERSNGVLRYYTGNCTCTGDVTGCTASPRGMKTASSRAFGRRYDPEGLFSRGAVRRRVGRARRRGRGARAL